MSDDATLVEATEPTVAPELPQDAPAPAAPPVEEEARGTMNEFLDSLQEMEEQFAPKAEEPTKAPTPPATTPEGEGKKEETVETTAKPRFQVLDGEGKPVDFKLPEGTKITFRADRQRVEVSDVEELVQYAQKGVFMERRLAQAETRESEMGRELEEARSRVDRVAEQYEEAIRRIVTDEDAYEAAVKAVEKFSDPDVKRLDSKVREVERKEEREKQAAERAKLETSEQLWGTVSDAFHEALEEGGEEVEFLRPEDEPAVNQLLHQGYLHVFNNVKADLISKGRSEEEAAELADTVAIRNAFTPANHKRVMKHLNDTFRARMGKTTPTPKPKAEDLEATAAAKNRRVNDKVQARDGAPPRPGASKSVVTVKSGGGREGVLPSKGRSYDDHKADFLSEFDKLMDG
jgi:hypothetical protein